MIDGRGMHPQHRRVALVVAASVCLALGACAGSETTGDLQVGSGSGGFAFEEPRRSDDWWATFAFPLCSSSSDPLTITGASLEAEVAPTEIAYRVLTYENEPAPDGSLTRGGFLKGLPEQVARRGSPYIRWGGRTPGTVADLRGVEVTSACDSDAQDQYVTVSMRVDPGGAAANALRLSYTDGETETTTEPTDWEMVACGREIEKATTLAEHC